MATTFCDSLDSGAARWHRETMHWTLAHMILDLTHNSIEAGASRVEVRIAEEGSRLRVAIIDNGKGMDEATRKRAIDPFYTEPGKHPSRRVGLGLPFLVQTVEQTGGTYRLDSKPGVGTEVHFTVDTAHLDCPPLGSIVDLAVMLFCFDGDYELILHRSRTQGGTSFSGPPTEYTVARSEMQDALGDLADLESRALLEDYLQGCESEIPPD
ncbi:MAG: ATP-binding protein [Spirochaetaceae bacterium]|nr:MAG: ATP-binding protein [Spirochaetaceae bacterium]